jgi:hypothetical protein
MAALARAIEAGEKHAGKPDRGSSDLDFVLNL